MADTATEIDLDSVIDRLLEGELALPFSSCNLCHNLDMDMAGAGWISDRGLLAEKDTRPCCAVSFETLVAIV